MQRIFLPPEDIAQREGIRLPRDKARYLLTVLRSGLGDRLMVIDGQGRRYEAEISALQKKDVLISILHEKEGEAESPFRLILCQGVLKGERMDLVIQKATELGISEIIPVVTERAVVRETRKTERWRKIAEESAEQCGRAAIPRIHEPLELIRFLRGPDESCDASHLTPHASPFLHGFVFWEGGGKSLREAFSSISAEPAAPVRLLIGPEGGLTREEVKSAEAAGLVRTSLGRRILRAETAAIVSVALAQFLLEGGDLV